MGFPCAVVGPWAGRPAPDQGPHLPAKPLPRSRPQSLPFSAPVSRRDRLRASLSPGAPSLCPGSAVTCPSKVSSHPLSPCASWSGGNDTQSEFRVTRRVMSCFLRPQGRQGSDGAGVSLQPGGPSGRGDTLTRYRAGGGWGRDLHCKNRTSCAGYCIALLSCQLDNRFCPASASASCFILDPLLLEPSTELSLSPT